MGGAWLLQAGRQAQGRALHHRDPAAQRDGLAAHGTRAEQYHPGHPRPLRAHARQGRAVAARHRPRRHRHPDGGGAPAAEGKQHRSPRHGPRGLLATRVGVEGRIGGHHFAPAAPAGRLLRLVARALHHGRRPVQGRAEGVRAALQGGDDLQGQAPCELGSEAADGHLRSRGGAEGNEGPALVPALPDRG